MRTILIDESTPLHVSFAVVTTPVPWVRSRLEFSALTNYAEGFRLCFSEPDDVRGFAAAVRRFAADCRELERDHLELHPPCDRPAHRHTGPSERPKPLSFRT